MSMNGIDIASYQAGLDLSKVPCDFVIIKATEGTNYVNPCCDGHFQQGLKLGKKLGVYHFASGGDAIAEADYFVEHIRGYIKKAILVLDWEADAVSCGSAWAKNWLDRVYKRTGVRPLIYMSNSVVNGHDWSAVAKDYGLWNAGYYAGYETMGYNPDAPLYGGTGAWKSGAAMYQYTSSGRLAGWGGNLDLDVFYGDARAWDAYAGGGEAPVINSPAPAKAPAKAEESPNIVFTYAARLADGTILPPVTNLSDFAGIQGKQIVDITIKVNKGKIRYRVHVLGGDWLPWVTGYNWKDSKNGYAGNGQVIDAIQIYYETPADIVAKYGYQKAQYRVAPIGGGYYPWQFDDETCNGQDGFAGAFGVPMDRFQLF